MKIARPCDTGLGLHIESRTREGPKPPRATVVIDVSEVGAPILQQISFLVCVVEGLLKLA